MTATWKIILPTLVGSVLAFGPAAPVSAASFDCAKAVTAAEKMICQHPALSKLDDELSAVYRQARGQGALPGSGAHAQRAWVKARNACASADCMDRVYRERIAELKKMGIAVAGKPSGAAGELACANPTSTVETNLCAAKEFDKVDQQLQQRVKTVLHDYAQETEPGVDWTTVAELFGKEQRAWAQYREHRCALVRALEPGTIRTSLYYECLAEETRERMKALGAH